MAELREGGSRRDTRTHQPKTGCDEKTPKFRCAGPVSEAEREAAANFSYEYECLAYYGTPESLDDEVRWFLAEYAPESDINA